MRLSALRIALASLIGTVLAGVAISLVPSVASASTTDPPKGYVEICKTFAAGAAGAPVYQGTFHYTISGGSGDGAWSTAASLSALEGGVQVCTSPILVNAGTVTVTEKSEPWFSVASITATQGDPGTVTQTSSNAASVTVNPAPSEGNQSLTTTVQYTNDPVTGIVEVCKQAAANSPSLTGTYTFNITSESSDVNVWDSTTGAYDLPWTTTASATISGGGLGCSGPIVVPAGTIQSVEPGTTYVTGITASSNGSNELVSPAPNLALGTSHETVLAGNTTNQTLVTYTDALSTVKLCKEWTNNNGDTWATAADSPTTSFPFTLNSSASSPAGPTAVTGTVGLTATECQIVGIVRAGTQVNITEGVVPGTKVQAITVSPTDNSQGNSPIVPSSLSLPNRTVSVIAGAGETDVYFTDESADPGWLKICVDPTTNPTAGTVPFTVGGTQTIDVNLSNTAVQCTLDPNTFAFDSSVSIAGGALPGTDAFTGTPSVVPTNVEVLEGGVPTATNQSSLSASTASSATVLMSEGIVTEVTFTVDPPAPVTAQTPTVTATPSVAQVAAASAAASGSAASGSGATTASISPRIARIEKQISSVKAQIKVLLKKLSSKRLSAAARKADNKKLAALRARERGLLRELK
jgi:hypothetical protein